jgi:hypothetical protein
MWRRRHYLFVVAGNRGGIIYIDGHSPLFFSYSFLFSVKRQTEMRACLGTVTPGQKGPTRGSASERDADVREETREEVKRTIESSVGGRGGDGDDDNIQDDVDEDEALEDNGWGKEEEEEEEEDEEQYQEDHVDVTNWMDLLNRSVTPPSPVNPSDTLFG